MSYPSADWAGTVLKGTLPYLVVRNNNNIGLFKFLVHWSNQWDPEQNHCIPNRVKNPFVKKQGGWQFLFGKTEIVILVKGKEILIPHIFHADNMVN